MREIAASSILKETFCQWENRTVSLGRKVLTFGDQTVGYEFKGIRESTHTQIRRDLCSMFQETCALRLAQLCRDFGGHKDTLVRIKETLFFVVCW